jgi:hypothetical protein
MQDDVRSCSVGGRAARRLQCGVRRRANERSRDNTRATAPACRTTQSRASDQAPRPITMASGTAVATSASSRATRRVERMLGRPADPPPLAIRARPFATRTTARRSRRDRRCLAPDTDLARMTPTVDEVHALGFRCKRLEAATVATCRKRRAWMASPDWPSVPRSHHAAYQPPDNRLRSASRMELSPVVRHHDQPTRGRSHHRGGTGPDTSNRPRAGVSAQIGRRLVLRRSPRMASKEPGARLRHSAGIIESSPPPERTQRRERATFGFGLVRPTVCASAAAAHNSTRRRRLQALVRLHLFTAEASFSSRHRTDSVRRSLA